MHLDELTGTILADVPDAVNYWARTVEYMHGLPDDGMPVLIRLLDREDGRQHVVTRLDILNTMNRIVEGDYGSAYNWDVCRALREGHAADFDADTFDAIAQLATMGEIIYG